MLGIVSRTYHHKNGSTYTSPQTNCINWSFCVVKLKLEFWYCPFKDVDITNIGNVHYTYRAFHKLLSTVKVPISFKTLRYVFDIMIIYFILCCGNITYTILKYLCGYIYFLLDIYFSSLHHLRYFHWKSFKLNSIK